jgi:hypothetical protein
MIPQAAYGLVGAGLVFISILFLRVLRGGKRDEMKKYPSGVYLLDDLVFKLDGNNISHRKRRDG